MEGRKTRGRWGALAWLAASAAVVGVVSVWGPRGEPRAAVLDAAGSRPASLASDGDVERPRGSRATPGAPAAADRGRDDAACREAELGPPEGAVRFELTVRGTRSAEPLADAVVEVQPGPFVPPGISPRREAPGRWLIDLPAGGSVFVKVRAPGLHERRIDLSAHRVEPGAVQRLLVHLDDLAESVLHVVDARGRPVPYAKVTVMLGHGERLERATGALGWITLPPFSGPGIGRRIGGWVEREGYLTSRFDVLQERPRRSPRGDEPVDPAVCSMRFMDTERHRRMDAVVLDRPAVVEGRVLDRAGRPAEGVELELSLHDWYPPGTCGTGLPIGGSWRTTTDAEGRYRFAAVPDPHEYGTPDPELGGPPAGRELKWFLVGPDGGVRFEPEEVLAEGVNRRDWRLGPSPRIRGTLVDARGAPLNGVTLDVRSWGAGSARVRTDGRGAFELATMTSPRVEHRDRTGATVRTVGEESVALAWGSYVFKAGEGPPGETSAYLTLRPGEDDVEIVLRLRGEELALELAQQ